MGEGWSLCMAHCLACGWGEGIADGSDGAAVAEAARIGEALAGAVAEALAEGVAEVAEVVVEVEAEAEAEAEGAALLLPGLLVMVGCSASVSRAVPRTSTTRSSKMAATRAGPPSVPIDSPTVTA